MRCAILVLLLPAMLLCQSTRLPEAPRPLSVDVQLEQRYSLEHHTATNPIGISLTYRTPLNAYRVGLGYSYTPQTGDQALTLSLKVRLFTFGYRR